MKMKDFQWTRHSKLRLPEIKEIFDQMWCYYDQYLKQAQDLPYWSTEMALVGNLAMAAAQLKKYSAALEFYNEKSSSSRLRRADLWLGISPSTQGLIVEAKRDWLSLTLERESISEYAKEYLKDADKYLRELRSMAYWCGSLFFAQIYVTKKALGMDYSQSVQALLKECKAVSDNPSNKISFFAYYFLESKEEVEQWWSKKYGCSYPGLVVFGRFWKA